MNEIQSLRSGQSEGTHKRGKRSSPRGGRRTSRAMEKDNDMSRAIQQDQGVFRVYMEVQDALQNNIFKNV